ncbi:DUF1127 domain-containing protein [Pseudoruegeria sp. HB172150]|uniref:DUF1127 domain-containing protein n=1 Tax=Pseudoruegeria sp. HB172150 TaxID=2721164 RepID=UPI00155530CD|nr:DUF1127 domain-containing protein [Pseudoruegeria sp. HB172150]
MSEARKRRERRDAIRELNAMSDELLWDIGIDRGQIEDYVDGLAGPAIRSRRAADILQFPVAACSQPVCCAA